MAVFKLIVVFLTFIVVFAKGCMLNDKQIERYSMECAAHSPKLLLEIAEHMDNPNSIETLDFLCHYDEEIVDVAICLLNKVKNCLPQESRSLVSMMISKDRMSDTLHFICEHKTVLLSDCMNEHLQDFMQCYMGRMRSMRNGEGLTRLQTSNPKDIICKVIRYEEQCFRENKGHCSDTFVKLVIQVLEKFFPMSECPKEEVDNKVETLLKSILVHGEPLKFKSGMFKKSSNPYLIVKN